MVKITVCPYEMRRGLGARERLLTTVANVVHHVDRRPPFSYGIAIAASAVHLSTPQRRSDFSRYKEKNGTSTYTSFSNNLRRELM